MAKQKSRRVIPSVEIHRLKIKLGIARSIARQALALARRLNDAEADAQRSPEDMLDQESAQRVLTAKVVRGMPLAEIPDEVKPVTTSEQLDEREAEERNRIRGVIRSTYRPPRKRRRRRRRRGVLAKWLAQWWHAAYLEPPA